VKVCTVCRARFRGDPPRCPLDGGELRELPDPLLGRTIGGRYVVTAKVGAGGMGTVYKARHEAVGRDVAIKFLSPDLAMDATNRKRFLREAKAANRINHEHIIDITDFGETDDGLVYLVMEFLVGRPLNEEIAKGPMPPPRALGIALQMAQALARAHELDVVHRDIKPDNVYLLSSHDGDFIKILDFGLAQMKGELRLTATGTVFGTPEYMAPEQARGAPATFAVDLYAVGCVLYEMLTGTLPFVGTTPDLIIKHMREAPAAPSTKRDGIASDIDELVLRLLEKKPEDRFLDAYALADELKRVLTDMSGAHQRPTDKTVGQTSILPGEVVIAPTNPPPAMPNHDTFVSTSILDDEDEDGEPQTQTMITEEAWIDRTDLFLRMAHEAHPEGDAPEWLIPAIEAMKGRIEEMKSLRKRLDSLAGAAHQQEDDMRGARLRIGMALDELGRDESRVLRLMAETEPRLEEARARLEELEKPLLRAWGSIEPMPTENPVATREVVEALREAGQLASIWIEAERVVATHEREMAERKRECEDLQFQIAQLKGRLGTVNAESDIDLGSLRDQTSKLDSEIRRHVDALVAEAEPVYRYLNGFPFIRERMGGVR
jgi:serine/threonine-protein kinase